MSRKERELEYFASFVKGVLEAIDKRGVTPEVGIETLRAELIRLGVLTRTNFYSEKVK